MIILVNISQIHDFPDEAKFLSDDDRCRVLRRLKADQQSSAEHEEFKFDYLWASLKDWKTYTGMMIYMGCDGALYAVCMPQEPYARTPLARLMAPYYDMNSN